MIDPEACAIRLREAGFVRVEAHTEALGFYLPNAEVRWKQLNAGLEGAALRQLTTAQQADMKDAHLAELETLMTPQGIWFDVSTNYALGWKPTSP